ncbi:hypothetical protein ACLQ2D_34220 [Streptomyces sp. DT199]|uniref:hypothetical protein n=1 Tax=Streptomyces TaxID=1883 RepID=UPI00131C623C|nr:hypothetical protein [Streptomyces sp. NRRL S-146]
MLAGLFSLGKRLGKQVESLVDEPSRSEGFLRSSSASLAVRIDRLVVRLEKESVRQRRNAIMGAACSFAREVIS